MGFDSLLGADLLGKLFAQRIHLVGMNQPYYQILDVAIMAPPALS